MKVDYTAVYPSGFKPYHSGHDWKCTFVELVASLAKATVDRCQPGVCEPEEWSKSVAAMAANLVAEMQYITGDRKRPADPEKLAAEIQKAFGVKK